ncbi:MAG: hypothetical protein QM640_11960 [Niabella sp.]
MKVLKPLHNLLLAVSGLFFIAAFCTLKKPLDIHLADRVYVVPFAQIFMAAAVYLSLIWLLYACTVKKLYSKKLYSLHIVLTIILFIIVIAAALWSNQVLEAYTRDNALQKFKLSIKTGQLIVEVLLTLTLIQLLYPINLTIGLFKSKKR